MQRYENFQHFSFEQNQGGRNQGLWHNQGYLRAGIMYRDYLEDNKDYEITPNNAKLT